MAVLGKGLFGSAAARHLGAAGWDTIVVGPDEPDPGSDYHGPHGAHFDEARIMVARGDAAEVELTMRTLAGVIDLERRVETPLLVQSGSVEVTRRGSGGELIDGVARLGADATVAVRGAPEGYLNPRAYIRAALDDLVAAGGRIVRRPATWVGRDGTGFAVHTDAGRIEADRIVVAAGAWSNQLLERRLAIRRKREYVLFALLDDSAAAKINMRPFVVHGRVGRIADIYCVPPLRYPDGRWYLKLGANTARDDAVEPNDIDRWYREGDSAAAAPDLIDAFRDLLPNVPAQAFHTERCVITYTPHGRPFVDQMDDGLYVALGGNGHGASWADGVGALAAALVAGSSWGGLERAAFRAVYEDEEPQWPRPLLLRDRSD